MAFSGLRDAAAVAEFPARGDAELCVLAILGPEYGERDTCVPPMYIYHGSESLFGCVLFDCGGVRARGGNDWKHHRNKNERCGGG